MTDLQSGPLHQPLPLQDLGHQHFSATVRKYAVSSLFEEMCLFHSTATVCVQDPGSALLVCHRCKHIILAVQSPVKAASRHEGLQLTQGFNNVANRP